MPTEPEAGGREAIAAAADPLVSGTPKQGKEGRNETRRPLRLLAACLGMLVHRRRHVYRTDPPRRRAKSESQGAFHRQPGVLVRPGRANIPRVRARGDPYAPRR